ncbi:MAG: hypothetical protein VB084_01280 [Syntrophomonadaceae bacterium]|nr:hypothetical protein [Syntrophomonadaceae bacterium]
MNWHEIIRRYSTLILLVAVLLAVFGVKSGLMPVETMKYGLIVPAVLEMLIITIILINISKILKSYKILRNKGEEAIDAWQKSLEVVVSPRIARLATMEPRLYYALYQSYKRKPDDMDQECCSTRRKSYSFLVQVLIFLCLLEIVAVTLLLPNRWISWKVLHLVLGLWAVLWLWADYRSLGLYNHRVTPSGIKFRLGLRYGQFIPWDKIMTIRPISLAPPGGTMAPLVPKDHPGVFYMGIGEVCNIEITLKEPQSFQGMIKEIKAVNRLLLSLEKPDQFLAAIRALNPGFTA